MTWNTQDTNLSWYVAKANMDYTISGQGTATSILDHLATTPWVITWWTNLRQQLVDNPVRKVFFLNANILNALFAEIYIWYPYDTTFREESSQTNVILQYKLLASILSAVCSVIQQS